MRSHGLLLCLRKLRPEFEQIIPELTVAGIAVEIEAISISDLRRWRAELSNRQCRWEEHPTRPKEAGGLSPYTLHGYIRATRRFFAWLVEEGHLKCNPAERLELPPLPKEPPKSLSASDLEKMIEAARDNPRDYAIVCIFADTAARVGGIANLKLCDVDLENCCAIVREKGRGGKRKARPIYFIERTAQALEAYLNVRPKSADGAVFISTQGDKGLMESGLYQVLKRCAKKAGVEGRYNPHSFRHGWARGALKNGADLSTVSEILGHSDVGVTARFYARWDDDELHKRHDEFTWLK